MSALPKGWRKVPLGEVVDLASGQVDPRELPYSEMLHVGGDNIESDTGTLFGMQRAGQLGLISGKYMFDDRDILYSKIRPYLNKVAMPDFAGVCSADIYPLRPKEGVATREFVARILRDRDFLDFAASCSSRTSIPKINRPSLLRYECRLPPLPEQKRIAAILDKADAIRRKRQEAIRLTEELLRSAFLEMFGDPVTNPKGWEVKKLGELIRVKSGDGLSAKSMDADGVYPVYGGNGVTGKHSRYMFESPQIVIGRVGVYCGAVHRTEPRAWVTDNALFVADKAPTLEDDYLEWALRMADLNQYAGRAAQPLISGERVYRVDIAVPAQTQQLRFANVLKKHRHLSQVGSEASSSTDSLARGLTQLAFSGAL